MVDICEISGNGVMISLFVTWFIGVFDAFACLPCILWFIVLTSLTVCLVAFVASKALMIRVHVFFNGLIAISRELHALS